jgi:hypothetical protein
MREEGGQQCKDGFCMYAEERLGNNINSAGITSMWEMIEALFHGIRTVMSESGRTWSGSFKLNWSSALQHFWEVILVLALTFAYSNVFTAASL